MRRLILLSVVAIATARYVDFGREKRDIEYHEWLTDAQKSELKALYESADAAALKKRTMELYDLLPSDQKKHWNGKYKEMCVAWIKEVATEEDNNNFKQWKEDGKMDEITTQYKRLKDKLDEKKKKDVELWEDECWELWKDEFPASRGRRSVMDLAQDKLSFLGEEKLAELKALKESGASDDVIRDKVVTWTLEHWKSKDSKVSTGEFVKKCYGWIKDVTQPEEYEAFEKLHHTDHEACRVKVREFLARLPVEKQTAVEKSLPLCDAIWYKQHQEEHGSHAGHGDHDHSAHKHHARRHLNTMHIEKFMSWLTKEQKEEIQKMEAGGDSYETLLAKMKTWYDALEGDKKKEVRSEIKDKCAEWVYAKTSESEQQELIGFAQDADKEALMAGLKKAYGRLTEEEQHEVDHTKEVCIAIWTTEPERKRRDHHHGHHEEYKEYFSWLTPEQGDEIKALREAGKHEEVYTKVDEYYAGLDGEKKTEATEKLKGACKHFFKDTFGEAAVEEIKQMKESGSSMDDIAKKVEEFIGKVTDEKKKAVASRASVNCKKIFSASRRRRDHHHGHHEEYKEYFSWLTPEQGDEVKALREAGKQEEVYKKLEEYYASLEEDKKTEATEKLKGACKHFFKATFGDAAVEEFKQMKESGASHDTIAEKVEEFIGKITDEKKKAVASRASANCKKIFGASRRRRDHHDEYAAYKEYFTWLTPEQGAEVKALREAGDDEAANKKVYEIFEALDGDKKTEATEKLKGACKHYFKDVFGEAAVAEIKQMKESGTSMDDIGKKVEEFLGKITDEKKKATATKASVKCKKLFGASRKRRDESKHVEYKEYFSWMTPEQAVEVKKLHESGDDEAAEKKVHEFYTALTGDKLKEATEKLKGACKHFFKDTFGEAATEEIKQMKESGASMDDIGKKVEEMIGKIGDEKKKAKATKITGNCKKVFGASRRRRHEHSVDEALTEFLPWMSDEQKSEIKALKASGSDKIGEKIIEFFDSVDADKKDDARSKLQAGCRHSLGHLIGEAATAEMKAYKESGATTADMSTKLDEIIGKMPEGAEKTRALAMGKNCKKVYGVGARRRRHEHSLEEGFKEFLPWITEEQKMELKNMKEAGAGDKIGDKVIEYYESVDADKKDEARSKLQAGCRHFIKHLIGDAASGEMKAMHESGSSPAEMAEKLDEIIDKIDDEEKKAKAERLSKNCKVVYGVATRKRRHEHSLEAGFSEFLPWITEEQKMELKNMNEAGAHDKLGDKVIEYFENVSADKKDEARTKLQAGCRHYLRHVLGSTVAGEMKAMHESGSSPAEMAKKLDEIIDKMDDEDLKEKAERLSKNCKIVYGVATRKRRHEHSLEEGLSEFLPWITEEQKMELKNMKEAGASDKIGDKVIEYFESVDADKKDEARSKLQAGCRHFLKHLLGDAVSGEMKAMHESGSSPAEMAKKLDEIIDKMDDAEKKSNAEKLSKNCRKVYGVDARKRRNTYGEFDERYHQYYNWLEDEQKEELSELKESGEDSAVLQKVSEYFRDLSEAKKEEARGQLKMGCRMRMRDLLGAEKAEEIRKMKDEGASKAEMLEKVGKFVDEMEDGEAKESARRSYRHCASILNRHRRDDGKTFADYTRWLTAEQKQELNAIIRSDSVSSDDIYSKLFEYVDLLEGEKRVEAQNQMRGACRLFRNQFLGESQSAKLTHMRQTGKKWGEIERVLDGMLHAIEDESKRRKAKAAMDACKVLYREYIN